MTWKGNAGKLAEYDQAILARAGIATTDRMLLQFYPHLVEDMLAWLEYSNAKKLGRKLNEYQTTTFGVRPKGKQYQFYVTEQRFRPAPR